jgi:hypothetical protein
VCCYQKYAHEIYGFQKPSAKADKTAKRKALSMMHEKTATQVQ